MNFATWLLRRYWDFWVSLAIAIGITAYTTDLFSNKDSPFALVLIIPLTMVIYLIGFKLFGYLYEEYQTDKEYHAYLELLKRCRRK